MIYFDILFGLYLFAFAAIAGFALLVAHPILFFALAATVAWFLARSRT